MNGRRASKSRVMERVRIERYRTERVSTCRGRLGAGTGPKKDRRPHGASLELEGGHLTGGGHPAKRIPPGRLTHRSDQNTEKIDLQTCIVVLDGSTLVGGSVFPFFFPTFAARAVPLSRRLHPQHSAAHG
jgi:hypothetical protein